RTRTREWCGRLGPYVHAVPASFQNCTGRGIGPDCGRARLSAFEHGQALLVLMEQVAAFEVIPEHHGRWVDARICSDLIDNRAHVADRNLVRGARELPARSTSGCLIWPQQAHILVVEREAEKHDPLSRAGPFPGR